MSFGVLEEVNWLAVIVGGAAYVGLGAVWFTPRMFGPAWMRSIGWEPTATQPTPGATMYLGPLFTSLLATAALAMFAEASGSDSFGEGIVLGLGAGIGLSGAVLFSTALFDPKKPEPMTWFAITAGYHAVGLLIASIVVALWT